MTDERTYELLRNILNTISEEDYPEIYGIIFGEIDDDECTVYEEAMYIAEELHEADGAKQLPKCVADFLMTVYTEELENGNTEAACNIGSLYYTGRAGEQNYAKALEYYSIAAKGGNRQAQENLGYCYYYGRSTEKDYEKAFHYFALGAFDGHINSLYKIGDMYRNGYYVEKNEREAFNIYKRCYETLTDEAIMYVGADVMMRMGDCLYEGIGVDVDYKAALKFYQESERLYFDRIERGDFLIRGCYKKVVERQNEVREKLHETMPTFDWTK